MSKLKSTKTTECLELLESNIISDNIIFVTGLPCSGKTTSIERVIKKHKEYIHVIINCNQIFKTSALYIHILKSLIKSLDIVYQVPDQVLPVQEFVYHYEQLSKLTVKKGFTKTLLVFDRVERYKNNSMIETLPVFVSLQDVNLVMVTCRAPIDIFNSLKDVTIRKVIYNRLKVIEIAPLKKEELTNFVLEQPPCKHEDLYKTFANNVVLMLYDYSTKNYIEIRSYCQQNFEHFLDFFKARVKVTLVKERLIKPSEEVTDSILEELDIHRRHGFITEVVVSFLESFKEMNRNVGADMRNVSFKKVEHTVVLGMGILIVAAYIAAYTRPSHDKRNFVKFQKRTRCSTRLNCVEDGAKLFTMERVLQIYKALSNLISDKPTQELPDSVLGDLQALEDLGIIKCHTGDGLSTLTQYKISPNLSKDYVKFLAQSDLELDLSNLHGLD